MGLKVCVSSPLVTKSNENVWFLDIANGKVEKSQLRPGATCKFFVTKSNENALLLDIAKDKVEKYQFRLGARCSRQHVNLMA